MIDASGVESPAAGGGAYANCHRGKGPSDTGACVTDGSYWLEIGYTNQFTQADLDTTYHWKVRTGSFSPDILMLGNTQRTVVSGDATVGWTLEIWAKPALKAYKAGCWGENNPCEGEATADSVSYSLGGYMRVLGINQSWPSVETGAIRDALRGTFITTNGMSQSWSFSAETFMVKALGPHFMTDGTTIAPGYVKVFLPEAYVLGLRGYGSLSDVTPTNLEVTVSGKQVTPTLTVQPGGLLVDTGVEHFSAPNPTIKLLSKGSEVTSPKPTGGGGSLTTPTSNVGSTPTTAAPVQTTRTSLRRGGSTPLASIYRAKSREVVKWSASGRCTVRGTRLAALNKAGTCRVTASVKRGSRYVVAVRKVLKVT